MTLTTFIFDFDGTIANSFAATLRVANELAPEFGYRPAQPDELEQLRGSSYRSIAEQLGIPWHKAPVIAARIRNQLSHALSDMPTFDGMPRALSQLRMRGIRLGILTSNDRRSVESFLAARELQYFDFIGTSASVWGKERRLRSLLRSRGLTVTEVAYVGDEVRDIEATKALGMRAIAVGWGYTSLSYLATHAPDHLVYEPADLLDIPGVRRRPIAALR
jgi:phosphoglycolate phosphatase